MVARQVQGAGFSPQLQKKNGCGYIQIEFYFKRLSSDFSHGPEFPKLRSINVLASLCAGRGLLQKAYMAVC